MRLTPEAKAALATTVRTLRERLLTDIRHETEGQFRLSLPAGDAGLEAGPRTLRARLDAWLDEQVRASAVIASAGATAGTSAGIASAGPTAGTSAGIASAGITSAGIASPGRSSGGRGASGRAGGGSGETAVEARARHLESAIKLAGATFLNRIVALRQMEALELLKPRVVTGGWQSPAYREFREFGPGALADDTEGYLALLRLVFDEMAIELPGLFGTVGMTGLLPIPAGTVRAVVEALDAPELADAWGDDTTLGWVYQFWNDPERERLDEKLRSAGKVENHEIASKTQLFTDRYIVEWMLQNSLGQWWLAICARNGWTPDVVATGTLDALEARRAEWRSKRERDEVDLEALMPLETDLEERWKYWVPRDLRPDAAREAPDSLRDLRILDPACGSGHFLVLAFHMLMSLYEEEARHRGEAWTKRQMAEWIIENNLHGIDIDPRAVQIAAASLMLEAWACCRQVEPRQINLVASDLGLASLRDDDPAVRELVLEVQKSTGIPDSLTMRIIHALKGADHLGTLLRVDRTVVETIRRHEKAARSVAAGQGDLFSGYVDDRPMSEEDARASIYGSLQTFLRQKTRADDLGLRARAEQLAAGVRFIRLTREGRYDLVIGNPPYQGTGKMVDTDYYTKEYPSGKADLSAAFVLRSLDLVRPGGLSLLLTTRTWMFINQFEALRAQLLAGTDIQLIGDFDQGAFSNEIGNLLSVTSVQMKRGTPAGAETSVAVLPTPFATRWRNDNRRAFRKEAALLAGEGHYGFSPARLHIIGGTPLIYWWDHDFLDRYAEAPKLGEQTAVRQGMATASDTRFLRYPWEVHSREVLCRRYSEGREHAEGLPRDRWVPFIKGAEGKAWMEPLSFVLRWHPNALEVKSLERDGKRLSVPRNEGCYFQRGVAFTGIGVEFLARMHRYCSVFGHKGSSVFPSDPPPAVCLMNSEQAREVLSSLNPGLGFEVGDVMRLPLFSIDSADAIVARLDEVFSEHEAAREASVEFRRPGASAWRYAQDWAQRAVDRPAGEPLPPYCPEHDAEPPAAHVSFAVGVALGRFGPHGEGIVDGPLAPARPAPIPSDAPRIPSDALSPDAAGGASVSTLPDGMLYLSIYSPSSDGLSHPAARPIVEAWEKHGPALSKGDLRTWLRLDFFPSVHRATYENRPIWFPLSSAKRSFVAWVAIHRWHDATLQTLLADHLHPELSRLEKEVAEVQDSRALADAASKDRADPAGKAGADASGRNRADRAGRAGTDAAGRNPADEPGRDRAEKRLAVIGPLRDELRAFIDLVAQCAEKGAPKADPRDPGREVDVRFRMDLDDGVMINSAGLWPLLEPQWKDPKKWWRELCRAEGKKDHDWAHLAARYFPGRVDAKCRVDPSLAVAHGCFWKYHPEKACAWEVRLQDEIAPDFRLEEPDAEGRRVALERIPSDRVREIREAEERRRARRSASPDSPGTPAADLDDVLQPDLFDDTDM